jgi:hypothetical protein
MSSTGVGDGRHDEHPAAIEAGTLRIGTASLAIEGDGSWIHGCHPDGRVIEFKEELRE